MRTARAAAWLWAALAGLAASPARAGEGPAGGGSAPAENVSYVPSDLEAVRAAFRDAEKALATGDLPAAARLLQQVVAGPREAVWPTPDRGVFEGAACAAHHRVLSAGPELLAAYEAEFGGRAAALLRDGVARRDPALLAEAADLYAPAEAGRRALLTLADVAIEAGDRDAALGRLERLEDLEEVSSPRMGGTTERWRARRLDRAAAALARDEAAARRVRAALAAATPERPARPAPEDLLAQAPPVAWETAGGGPTRSRPAPAVRGLPAFAWRARFPDADPRGPWVEAPGRGRAERPSPWLPPRAVVADGRVIVSTGRTLLVFDLATGRPVMDAVPLRPDVDPLRPVGAGERGLEARRRWGWIEGPGLTVAGDIVYATVPAERGPLGEDAEDGRAAPRGPSVNRGDHVLALRLGPVDGTVLWRAGGDAPLPGFPEGLRLVGTPLLYEGSLHLAGVRTTAATRDHLEAWLLRLDPATGTLRGATFLGAGNPIRPGRDDEAVPSSCAGARGRVVVVTSLGVAAAVDATTGRTQWSLRYDRGRPDRDAGGRRLESSVESSERTSSFLLQPPRIAHDLCFLAPTDARHVFGLNDRPRGPDRLLRRWSAHRTEAFYNLAVEQVVGVTAGAPGVPATLVLAGQGYAPDATSEAWACVVGLDPDTGVQRWQRALPFGGEPEPFGEALLTRTEAWVPTARGIARFALADGAQAPSVEPSLVPEDRARLLDAEEMLFGNLVPAPGRGVLAVGADGLVLWAFGEP